MEAVARPSKLRISRKSHLVWWDGRDAFAARVDPDSVFTARMDGAMLWRVGSNTESKPSYTPALCWRESGILLAVAKSISPNSPVSIVTLLDAETGDRVATAALKLPKFARSPLLHLAWPRRDKSSSKFPLISTRILALRDSAIVTELPPISPLSSSSHPPFSGRSDNTLVPVDLFDRIVRDVNNTDILCAFRKDGTVEFSMWGLFYIGSFRLPIQDLVGDHQNYNILETRFAGNLETFYVAFEVENGGESILHIAQIRCRLFEAHLRDLTLVAHTALQLSYWTDVLAETMGALAREFESFAEASSKQVKALRDVFLAQEETITPFESLEMLLATGHPNPSLESYLCGHSLGERGLRKWRTSFQTANTNLQKLTYDRVIPVLERITLYLTDVLCSVRAGLNGMVELEVKEESVMQCLATVADAADEITRTLERLEWNFECVDEFFVWVTFAIENISANNSDVATPDIDSSKVLKALENLSSGDWGGDDSEADSSFFSKDRTENLLSCSSLALRLKSNISRIFDAIPEAVDKQNSFFSVNSHETVSSMGLQASEGENQGPTGWGSKFSMELVDDRIGYCFVEHDHIQVIIQRDGASRNIKIALDTINISKDIRLGRFAAVAICGEDVFVAAKGGTNTFLIRLSNKVDQDTRSNCETIVKLEDCSYPHYVWVNKSQRIVSVGGSQEWFQSFTFAK